MTAASHSAPRTVGFVLYDGCTLLDFAGATQVFAPWAARWRPRWLAPGKGPICTSEGVEVLPTDTFDDHPDLDIVFVPGGGGDAVRRTMSDRRYVDWLTRLADEDDGRTWAGAVCVGAFILAAAGLLENTRATTHWLLVDELRRLSGTYVGGVPGGHPRSCIDHGARRFTGGGVSSSIDLALALVQSLEDDDTANEAALVIQYAPELPKGVRPGDPDHAEHRIVERVRARTRAKFVEPISEGVSGLIERR